MLTLIALMLAVLVAVGVVVFGNSRWQERTTTLRASMRVARIPIAPTVYDAREIEALPPPVKRYFHAVLTEGQAMIAGVHVSQRGQFRQSLTTDQWQPFDATQFVTVQPPGFDWDARIKWTAGVNVYVRDAYAAGAGTLHAAVLGLFTVAKMHGTPELAQGELMRYLGEAAWYPTALLPSQGVRWEGIDDWSARATLTDGATSVSLEFSFDQEGMISTAWANARQFIANGVLQNAPWQGRFGNYAMRGGMRVPLEAEVEWQLPDGPLPYWRRRLTDIEYEFAMR